MADNNFDKVGTSLVANEIVKAPILDGVPNNEVSSILDLSFKSVTADRERLVGKFGGKGYGLLLARSLAGAKTGFEVPHFELIPTDFSDKLIVGGNREVLELLEKIDDASYHWYDAPFRNAITLIVVKLGYLGEVSYRHTHTEGDGFGGVVEIEEGFKITNGAGGWCTVSMNQVREYLQKQLEEGLNFSEEQRQYLEGIYNKFKDSKFLAVRSSADIEDNGKSNMPGVFYSGFCPKNFTLFLNEVKNVIVSRQNGGKNTKMGVVVMDVVGEYRYGEETYPDIEQVTGNIKAKSTFNRVELYYPDGGGVMMTSNPYDDSVTEIHGVQGLPTTVTGGLAQGVKIVLGKGSSKRKLAIVGVENTPGNQVGYKQVVTAGLDKFSKTSDPQNFHFTSSSHLNPKKYGKIGYDNCVPFEESFYFELVQLGKFLEKTYGYPLDVEFVVHAGKIHVIQIRKLNGVQKRPENMNEPDLEGKEIILDGKDVISSFGFVNNEVCDIAYGQNGHGRVMFKAGREEEVFSTIERIEKVFLKPHFISLANLQDFPVIDRSSYPNLRGIIVMGDSGKGLGTHVLMRIIESGIPMIFAEYFPRENMEDITVFIDGSKRVSIYK